MAKSTGKTQITLVVKDVKLGFSSLFKVSAMSGKYEANLLLPKDDPQTKEIMKQIVELSKKVHGDPALGLARLRDGDLSKYAFEHGHIVLRPKATVEYPPQILDRKKAVINKPSEIYPGVIVSAVLGVSAYQSDSYGPQVSVWMNVIQKIGAGEPLSNRVDNASLLNDEGDESNAGNVADEDEPMSDEAIDALISGNKK